MNRQESPMFGYKIKAELGVALKNRITLSGGIAFLQIGEETRLPESKYDYDGLVLPRSPEEGQQTLSYRYNSLSIPLTIIIISTMRE